MMDRMTDPEPEMTTLPAADLGQLLAVATLYLDSFGDDEMMTLPVPLQYVEEIVERYGRRY